MRLTVEFKKQKRTKDSFDTMLILSAVLLALGNSLILHCKAMEKNGKVQVRIVCKEMKKLPEKSLEKKDNKNEDLEVKDVESLMPSEPMDEPQATITKIGRKFFGTKKRAKKSFFVFAKCLVIFYILFGYLLDKDQEVPELLFAVGLVTFLVKIFV